MIDQFKLDFVIVGPQKAGTSWIYYYLKDTPQICFPSQMKETFFFDRYYEKGLHWYARHFKLCRKNDKIGEVAPKFLIDCISLIPKLR